MAMPTDPDRYADLQLELTCPRCGSAGLIPWQHLDRRLFCRGCATLFRVEPHGLVEIEQQDQERIVVQVRTSSSEWRRHAVVLLHGIPVAERLRDGARAMASSWPARLLAVVAVTWLAVWAWPKLAGEASVDAVELPTSLEGRATLLAEAIVRRDMSLLIPLTDPSQHRALRIWLAHGKDLPPRVDGDERQMESQVVTKAITTPTGDHVEVRVRVRLPEGGKEFSLSEQWVQRAEAWYFRPVRLRSPAPAATWDRQKQRRIR